MLEGTKQIEGRHVCVYVIGVPEDKRDMIWKAEAVLVRK